jgi:hypothetical protein
MWKFGTLFIGLGSAIMALNAWPAASNYLVDVFGPRAKGMLISAGGIVVCLGIIAILITSFRWIFNKVIVRFFSSIGEYIDPVFMAKPASSNELGQIFRMGSDLFEGGVSSINQMKRWHRVNPRIFWVLRKNGERGGEIKGYFCVIPLKARAAEMLVNGDISGKDFTVEHILAPTKTPTYIYIGAIAASGFRARGAALHKLLFHIEQMKAKGTKHVLTNPVTRDGSRLVKKFGFECVPADGDCGDRDKIHQLNLLLA